MGRSRLHPRQAAYDLRKFRGLGVPAEPDRAVALNDHRGRIEALAFSPDGHILATGSADTTVGLWIIG